MRTFANLYARIEPEVKEKAESILSALGIPASSAINMFYKQIILQRGLPFEVKIPSARPVDISTLSEVEFNEELEKGYADMHDRRTKNAKKAFADLREIFEYIAFELQSPENAIGQLDRLEEQILSLDAMPKRYRKYEKEPWKSR